MVSTWHDPELRILASSTSQSVESLDPKAQQNTGTSRGQDEPAADGRKSDKEMPNHVVDGPSMVYECRDYENCAQTPKQSDDGTLGAQDPASLVKGLRGSLY